MGLQFPKKLCPEDLIKVQTLRVVMILLYFITDCAKYLQVCVANYSKNRTDQLLYLQCLHYKTLCHPHTIMQSLGSHFKFLVYNTLSPQ
jgi:hypothetical protein